MIEKFNSFISGKGNPNEKVNLRELFVTANSVNELGKKLNEVIDILNKENRGSGKNE